MPKVEFVSSPDDKSSEPPTLVYPCVVSGGIAIRARNPRVSSNAEFTLCEISPNGVTVYAHVPEGLGIKTVNGKIEFFG